MRVDFGVPKDGDEVELQRLVGSLRCEQRRAVVAPEAHIAGSTQNTIASQTQATSTNATNGMWASSTTRGVSQRAARITGSVTTREHLVEDVALALAAGEHVQRAAPEQEHAGELGQRLEDHHQQQFGLHKK